jgi:CHAT domain-containing protein
VQYLPGNRKEVSYSHDLLTRNQLQSSLYLAEKGNEESFKSLDGQANHILHVATHGFFWSQVDAPSADYHLQTVLNSKQQALAIDPLSRCGLLLAGANLSLSGRADQLPEGVQDGILTAKEISLLDLSHTQVAVLSACETAAGEVTSEGVFGLQRGLKQAGVQTIIMSLWPVDDAATQLLMQHFYTIWIKNNTDKRQAFQMAQKTLKKQYPDPKFWAGFILLD